MLLHKALPYVATQSTSFFCYKKHLLLLVHKALPYVATQSTSFCCYTKHFLLLLQKALPSVATQSTSFYFLEPNFRHTALFDMTEKFQGKK